MSDDKKVAELLAKAGELTILGPVGYLLVNGFKKSAEEMSSATGKQIEELRAEAAKQEIIMEFQLHQAKVAQEIAIAKRITSAEEVEIEEYYDLSGTAEIGLAGKPAESEISFGAKGSGRKVTKRIYRFKGKADFEEDAIQIEQPKE